MSNKKEKLTPLLVPYEGAKEESERQNKVSIDYTPPKTMLQKLYDMCGRENINAKLSIRFKK